MSLVDRVLDTIFFTQERVGLDGKTFTIYKFRTMERGKENERAALLEIQGRDKFGYIIDDPRITFFGGYLRMFWIDELPQIMNFLKRDMNLIGPRPLMPEDYEELPPDLKEKRKKVRPGLIPVTYVDYFSIKSDEDRWESERGYFNKREKNPQLTDLWYLARAFTTITKIAKSNFTIEMYKWTNSYPYL